MSRHPSDAERERAAAETLRRYRDARAAGDLEALSSCYAEGCVWLTREGRLQGPDAARERHAADAVPAGFAWTRTQQSGAHAVLGWQADSTAGLEVLEIRRGEIVFKAD